MRNLHKNQLHKPVVKFYKEWTEVQEIYNSVLGAQEVYAVGSVNKLKQIDEKFFKFFNKKIGQNKVIFYDLLPSQVKDVSNHLPELVSSGLYSMKYLPSYYKDAQTDILIWEDNIALVSLMEPVFGTVIVNRPLADTLRALLKVIWNNI